MKYENEMREREYVKYNTFWVVLVWTTKKNR